MQRQLLFTTQPIEEAALQAERPRCQEQGAVVTFVGVVRGSEAGAPIAALDYECFEPMAKHQLEKLLDELGRRWPVQSVRLVHRLGVVPVGQASLWVEVAAPHRQEAFGASQWLIEQLKAVVPIWKKAIPAAG